MKANELRLGNYVNVPNTEQCPFRIDAFEYCSEKFIKVAQEVKLNGFEVYPLTWYGEYLEPIALTEEWLLNLGFIKKNGYGFIKKDLAGNLFYSVETKEHFMFQYHDLRIKIKHVHQLQNLYFALTGEELILKSEK
jgi:hypothetical protein